MPSNNIIDELVEIRQGKKKERKPLKLKKFIERIFSVKNIDTNKVIRILGIKIKFKNKYKILENRLNNLQHTLNVANGHINGLLTLHPTVFNILQRMTSISRTGYTFAEVRNTIPRVEHKQNVDNLFLNLDDKAKENLLIILERQDKLYYNQTLLLANLYSKEELESIQKCRELLTEVRYFRNYFYVNNYKLPINFWETSTFINKHGIHTLKTLDKVGNKSLFDVGCHVGDSILIFREFFKENQIYSFEPSFTSYNLTLKTINLNNITNVQVENCALADTAGKLNLINPKNPTATISDNPKGAEIVEAQTLDNYVSQNKIEVGLIKVNIEGFEQNFLRGAYNTIKEQKPILLISIYHDYESFYKTKLIIEGWNLGYKFDFFQGATEQERSASKDILLMCEVY